MSASAADRVERRGHGRSLGHARADRRLFPPGCERRDAKAMPVPGAEPGGGGRRASGSGGALLKDVVVTEVNEMLAPVRGPPGRVRAGARLHASGSAGRQRAIAIASVTLGEVRGPWARATERAPAWRAVYSLAATRRPVKAGAMGFFDDLPAPEPAPPRRHHPWEPPEAEFPGIVPIDTLLLGRTDQVAVAVTGLSAFSAGVEIFLTARIRPSAGHPGEHLPGGPRDLAPSRRSFRFGLQFSDGGKASGSPAGGRPDHDSEPAAPVLYPVPGGGGPPPFVSRWGAWPPPPPGALR